MVFFSFVMLDKNLTGLQDGHLFTGERAAAYQGSLWQMPSCPKMQTCGSISSSEWLEISFDFA